MAGSSKVKVITAAMALGVGSLYLQGCGKGKDEEADISLTWYNTTVSGNQKSSVNSNYGVRCLGGRCWPQGTKIIDYGHLQKLPSGFSKDEASVEFHFDYQLGYCKKRYTGDDIIMAVKVDDPATKDSEKTIAKKTIEISKDDYPSASRGGRCGKPEWSPVVVWKDKIGMSLPFGSKGVRFKLHIRMGNRNIQLRTKKFVIGLKKVEDVGKAVTALQTSDANASMAAQIIRKRHKFHGDEMSQMALSIDAAGQVHHYSKAGSELNAFSANSEADVGDDDDEDPNSEDARVYHGKEITLSEFMKICVEEQHNTTRKCSEAWSGNGADVCEECQDNQDKDEA